MSINFLAALKNTSEAPKGHTHIFNINSHNRWVTEVITDHKSISHEAYVEINTRAFEQLNRNPTINLNQKIIAYLILKNTQEEYREQINKPNHFLTKIPVIKKIYLIYLRLSTNKIRKESERNLRRFKDSFIPEANKNIKTIQPNIAILLGAQLSPAQLKELDKNQKSPIAYSAQHFDPTTLSVIDKLLKCGADINGTDKNGNTALHYAAINNNPILINELLRNKANAKQKNSDGLSPISFAQIHNKEKAKGAFAAKGLCPTNKEYQTIQRHQKTILLRA